MAKLVLADGTVIDKLIQNNGYNADFTSAITLNESTFADNLDQMLIVFDDGLEQTWEHVRITRFEPTVDGGTRVTFRMQSDAEIAMTDVQLAIAEIYEMLLGGE